MDVLSFKKRQINEMQPLVVSDRMVLNVAKKAGVGYARQHPRNVSVDGALGNSHLIGNFLDSVFFAKQLVNAALRRTETSRYFAGLIQRLFFG